MKKIFTTLFLMCLAIPASAQITLTSSDFLSQNSETSTSYGYDMSNTSVLQALINQAGAGVTWTFGGTGWVSQGTSTSTNPFLPYPSGAAEASQFTGATNVIVAYDTISPGDIVAAYIFFKIDNTGIWDLGSSQDSAGTSSVLLQYTPPLQLFAFPLTYQTSWQSVSSIPAADYGLPDGAQITEESDGLCDGYGTLSVPDHSEDALRVRVTDKTVASYLSIVAYSSKSTTFNWYTKSGFGASIGTDSIGSDPMSITDGNYSVPGASGVALSAALENPLTLRLSQNPASNSVTNLSYIMPTDGPVQVMLMDPLGRDVKMLVDGNASAGTHLVPINPASLASGNYFLRVSAAGKVATLKLVIVR